MLVKILFRRFLSLFLIVGVLSCSSLPQKQFSARSVQGELVIAFTYSRQSELEPCGCSLRPLGGIDREWNLIQNWRKSFPHPLLALSGGTTFTPANFSPKEKDHFIRKSHVLVEAMNHLGTRALSPSAYDANLGLDTLSSLEKESKFPWISSNLYSKATHQPLFKRYLEWTEGGVPLLLVGLSHEPSPLPEGVEVMPPLKTLENLFREVNPRSHLVILISSLGKKEREEVLSKFPQVNLVFGGELGADLQDIEVFSENALYINPYARGRSVARIDVKVQGTINPLFNLAKAVSYSSSRFEAQADIEDIDARLKKPIEKDFKEELENRRAKAVSLLEHTRSMPMVPPTHGTFYQWHLNSLDSDFEKPANVLTHLVKHYKEELRKLAVDESESQ